MKTYKTKKGYCYKEYKNGKKKRISNEEYNKLRKKNNKKQKGGSNPPSIVARTDPRRTAISLNSSNNTNLYNGNISPSPGSPPPQFKHKIITKNEIISELQSYLDSLFGPFIMNPLYGVDKETEKKHTFYSIMFDYVKISPNSDKVSINFNKNIKLKVGKKEPFLRFNLNQRFDNKQYTLPTNRAMQQQIINHIKYKLTVMIKLTEFFHDLKIYDEIIAQDWENPSILVLSSSNKRINNKKTFYTDIPYRTNKKTYNNKDYIYIGWVDVYLSRYIDTSNFNIYIFRRKLTSYSSIEPHYNIVTEIAKRNNDDRFGEISVGWGPNPSNFSSRTGYVSSYRQFAHLKNEHEREITNTIAFKNLNLVECIGCLTINNN